jgi:predicted ATPase/DNA-binding SARP family transcriptional activator/DNA-binding CsgD family transcriptional regulator
VVESVGQPGSERVSAAGSGAVSTAPDSNAALRITLLGGFQVAVGACPIADAAWRLRKARSLVKLLALSPGHRLHRERALDALWPELPLEAAANNLHRALHAARRALTSPLAGSASRPSPVPSPSLVLRHDILHLYPAEQIWVDAVAFEQAAAVARRDRAPQAYDSALALYAGDLLPEDVYEDWAAPRREALRGLHAALLAEAAALQAQRGDTEEAIHLLQRLVAAQPANEEAHVALIRLYALRGQRYEALRQYQALRNCLRRELDVAPETASQQLYEDIRGGRFPAAPPDPAISSVATTLSLRALAQQLAELEHSEPAQREGNASATLLGATPGVTTFIGRERELQHVTEALGTARLLTLTGAGGCGKTRLAVEVASRSARGYCDGATFVDLAALADADLVPQVVAGAMGASDEQGTTWTDTLIAALAARQALLVLDNCEHLREGCARLAQTLLDACPQLRILATSRRRLRLAAEVTWRVPSLASPDPDSLPSYEDLLAYDAIRLFVTRAASSRPGFALTPANAAMVVRICARLEGIPLALELAAGRCRYLTVEQIADRLDDSLQLLGGGDRTGSSRHATLRAAIDWSHNLLSEPERILFRRLAVFASGWTLEAAEAVCAGEPLRRSEVLNPLALLADHSLVTIEERGQTLRYRLLEPIRQYATEKLAAVGEEPYVRAAHAAWCVALAEQAEPHFSGTTPEEQQRWLHLLDPEVDNLRAALSWCVARDEADLGLRLAAASRHYWHRRNSLAEGRRWLETALALRGSEARPELRAKAAYEASALAMYRGDLEPALRLGTLSLALYRALGDETGVMRALTTLGGAAEIQGDYRQATAYYAESLALARQQGWAPMIFTCLSNLADVATAQDEWERATGLYSECLALGRELADPRYIGMAATNLGKMALRRGDLGGAAAFLREGLALAQGLEDRMGVAEVLLPLGHLALALGDAEEALRRYADALTRYHEANAQPGTARCLEALSHLALMNGRTTLAARLAGAAEGARARAGTPLTPAERPAVERDVASLRAVLDEDAFVSASAAGYAAPLDQIVAEALSQTSTQSRAQADAATRADQGPRPGDPLAGEGRIGPPTPLTAREREIAALVAGGLTNREIATWLDLSLRTVDTHVRNILAKLGVASRAQVAATLPLHPDDRDDEPDPAV